MMQKTEAEWGDKKRGIILRQRSYAPDTGAVVRGLVKVISARHVPLHFAEVVQADFDQCGSMWMSVQPEGAT